MTRIAVLIPVHNGELYLKRALDSVVEQTYLKNKPNNVLDEDVRIIIVNNNSTDGTKKIIDEFTNKNALKILVTYLFCHEPGIVPTLNTGLFYILSERIDYVARLDADDYWHPEKLEKQVAFLKENPDVDILGTQIQRVTPEFGTIPSQMKYPCEDEQIKKALLSGYNAIAHPSVIVRTKIFARSGVYDNIYPLAEDLHLWLKASRWFKFANLEEVLVDYMVAHNPAYNPLSPQLAALSTKTAFERLHK